jgi:GMP synthase (glutamine-hydrolysing)
MKILCILHALFETPGYIEHWVAKKGYALTYCSPFKGEHLPQDSGFDLIISMGGPQNAASDLNKYPYLKDEVVLLRNALKTKIPVFGFCLGAQLIGEALGASAEPSHHKEIGIFPILLTKEGIQDPLLAHLPQEFNAAHWHSDMPGLTKEAVVLAKSEGCPRQIVRYLPYAYGFQCHPEMTLQGCQELIKNCSDDFTSDKYVQTPQDMLTHDFYAMNYGNMVCILENFLQLKKSWSSVLELVQK